MAEDESDAPEGPDGDANATPPDPDGGSSTPLNALVGAAVTVVTAPLLPFAAVVGGAVAGYLERGNLVEGAKVGALSGIVAAVPAAFLAWLVVGVLLLGADPVFAFTSVFAAVLASFVVTYLVGAGAFGGALGAYLRREL